MYIINKCNVLIFISVVQVLFMLNKPCFLNFCCFCFILVLVVLRVKSKDPVHGKLAVYK